MKKIGLIIAILSTTLLVACQGGQVELPSPTDNTSSQQLTNPVFGLAVGDSSQERLSESQVEFKIPWTAININPQTQGTHEPLVYFALRNGTNGPVIQDAAQTASMASDRVQGTVSLTVSPDRYQAFCDRSIQTFAAINPDADDLPRGNSVDDGYEAIPETNVSLPEGMAKQYKDSVDIVCEEDLTASLTVPAVEEGQTVAITAQTTGSPDEYRWQAEQGEIEGTGQTVTYTAPQVDTRVVGSDTVTLTVTRGQEQAQASSDVIVQNTDYEISKPVPS